MSGAFKARKRIPADVRIEYQALYGPAYEAKLTIPAGTTPQRAKVLHTEWLADVEGRIATLRGRNGSGVNLTQRQAAALAGEWYRWFVDQHIENPGRASHWAELDDVWWNSLIDVAGDPETGEIDIQAPEVREELHPLLAHDARTDKFLTDRGVVLTEASRAGFLSAVLRVFLNALETLQRRAAGDWSPDKRLETLPPPQPIAMVLKDNRSSTAEKALPSATALFEAYCLHKKSAPSTVSRWRPVFAALDALPEPVANQRQAQAWLDGLRTPDRSARTVHDIWLSAARTIYRWASRRHLIESNPFEGCVVEVPRQVTTRETGRAFTEAEAATVLHAALAAPQVSVGASRGWEWAACRRWVPWLCAYTGARVREMTQLRAGDVEKRLGKHGPLWVLKVTPEAGTVKTGKARAVPVHPHLVEMGFAEFAEHVKAALSPEAPLFFKPPEGPSRNPQYRGPAVKARERLAAWVREQGVTDPGVSPNHAWRHLFKTRARRAAIEAGVRDAIVGHAPRSTAEKYEHVTVEDMAEALKRFPRYTVAAPPNAKKR